MERGFSLLASILTVLLVYFPGTLRAQDITVDGTFGFGHPIGVKGNEWNANFSVGANYFLWPIEGLGMGFQFGYDRWMPPPCKKCGDVDALLNPDAVGSTTVFEIIPSARISTEIPEYGISFFGQAGAGLFILRANSDATGMIGGKESPVQFDNGKWIGRWGIQAGPGISIALDQYASLNVFPMYTAIFNGDRTFQYFNTHIGLSLKF